jgi:hypothetical protein
MMRKVWRTLGYAGVLVVLCAGLAKSANDVPFPTGFRSWFAINSMIVGKDSPLSAQIGGLHIIYANPKALATLRKAGPFPYPDGAVFADDVHDFTIKDGTTSEGPKKAVTVMVKDSAKYASTGGWGFQVWAGGDPKKPLIDDATVPCYTCHTQQKDKDFVFSTWIP